MSLTKLKNLVTVLKTIRPARDEIDRGLAITAIEIDALHNERPATIEDVERWFCENYHGEIEPHAEYIREQLDWLTRDPGPNSPG